MTDEIDSTLSRIEAHYPDGADLTLQVLKGHLLVEELVREILELLLAYPEALKGSRGTRFDCHQVICLVQAITKHSALEPWVWDAAKRLNGIRNELAHNLQPRSLDERVNGLIQFVTQENLPIKAILDRLGTPEGSEFKAVILAMCACLVSLKIVVTRKADESA